MNTLILASASPRRRALLAQLGAEFRSEPAGIDERRLTGESPGDMTVRLALLKAQTVFARVCGSGNGDHGGGEHPVLAGDTAVALGDEILGKPADRDHAMAMLARLSGHTHTVFSAVALVAGGHRRHRLSVTEVAFDRLSRRQIARYCAGAQPFDKAGAYGIQGAAGAFVHCIKGSYSGVVGLPLRETWLLLRAIDYPCHLS